MRSADPKNTTRKEIKLVKRRAIAGTQTDWVNIEYLRSEDSGPMVILPAVDGFDLVEWAGNNSDFIERSLLKHGAILFRKFDVCEAEKFEQFIKAISPDLLSYRERSSPRRQVYNNIYTSTDYPAGQSIFLHNENSYQQVWPMKIFFFCVTPATQGGETPIADTRKVLKRLTRSTLERFRADKCMYIRNFDDAFGLSWQTVFQTSERAAVEQYCLDANISFDWRDNDRLRTRAVRPAIATHPRTGEEVWFNHVAFFHVSTLEPTIREGLMATMNEDDLPANTCYGDGAGIESQILDEIRSAYQQEAISFPWKQGDILLLDNMLMAHSRNPYAGPRKVLVGMSESYSRPRDTMPGGKG